MFSLDNFYNIIFNNLLESSNSSIVYFSSFDQQPEVMIKPCQCRDLICRCGERFDYHPIKQRAFLFYDQEPIEGKFNFELLDFVCNNYLHGSKFILVTTEKDSETLELIKAKYNCPVVYYFHHVFAAHDWFRGVHFDSRLIAPKDRKLKKIGRAHV